MICRATGERASRAARYTSADFDSGPFVVFYEVTQACDLACRHCRACAQPSRHASELDTPTAKRLVRQLAEFPKPPLLILTGGDPLKRPDLRQLVRLATLRGLEVALTPSATPLVTRQALNSLREAGLKRLAISLDGADAATHDALRGVDGSFDRSLDILADARACGLPLQINTTITPHNLDQIDHMADLAASLHVVLWSVFFLVPVGRGARVSRITPEQYEQVFARLWRQAQKQPFGIKTTEAPHYRRYLAQKSQDHQSREPRRAADAKPPRAAGTRGPLGINDGKGTLFIGHTGLIYPSGFLPLACGTFPDDSVVEVYRQAPLFRALRQPDRLEGKCGGCSFRHICGGSRARSFALSGNPLAAEPDCAYVPPGWHDA